MGCWYLLLFPLIGLVQSSNPETSERHGNTAASEANGQYNSITELSSLTYWKSQTCEVDGLYGLDEIRLLNLKPLQQLSYEAHDVQLRKRAY